MFGYFFRSSYSKEGGNFSIKKAGSLFPAGNKSGILGSTVNGYKGIDFGILEIVDNLAVNFAGQQHQNYTSPF